MNNKKHPLSRMPDQLILLKFKAADLYYPGY